MSVVLRDLGERRILMEIVPKYCAMAGDDCGVIDLGDRSLVCSTDPVPTPAAEVIAGDQDPYWRGWLLVTINASDLAAAGATPVAFLAALEAPPDSPLRQLERMLAGVADACDAEGLTYVGGNLREGPGLSGVGTALGVCEGYRPLTRTGLIEPGDLILSIGALGRFWADALSVMGGEKLEDPEESPLYRPRSQGVAMRRLAKSGLLKAAIDNSDGLFPSLRQLAAANDVGLSVDLRLLRGSVEVRQELNDVDDPVRLAFGWGDWNVLAIATARQLEESIGEVEDTGVEISVIGTVVEDGDARVMLEGCDGSMAAPRIESERFARDSWFSSGIDAYVAALLDSPLGRKA